MSGKLALKGQVIFCLVNFNDLSLTSTVRAGLLDSWRLSYTRRRRA